MIEKKIEEYLNSKHCVLWGRSFSLRDKKDMDQAKEWLLDLIIDLDLDEQHPQSAPERVTDPSERPSWDEYYKSIARVVAARGDCSRAKHGAVIVQGHRIVSTGYNGTPPEDKRSCLNGDCPRAKFSYEELPSGSSYDTGPGACIATHAEANAVLRASWEEMQGSTIYVTGQPCGGCEKLIKASGIERVVW